MRITSWWEPPDAAARELAREGEARAAQMRLVVAAMGALTVLLALSFRTRIYITGYGVMFAVGAAELLLTRRIVPPAWLNVASCLFDITLVNLMNAALVATGNPLAVTNSKTFFTVTFLFLSLTCLRQDPRLSLLTGLTAIAQYAALLAWISARYDLASPVLDHTNFGAYTWQNQATRFSLLAAATAINVVIINTSRAYWRDSVHDALTGLVNRRYAERRLDEALAAARRTRHPLVVALADVDHFKVINDEQGHAAGDRVLRTLADLLHRTFRSSDVLARYGGDEFFILLPDSDPAATMERLAQFHADLLTRNALPATISIGVASWPADGDDADALLARADERLYAAKEAGRGRIMLPPPAAGDAARLTPAPA